MAYCEEGDLRVGDVPLPNYIVKSQYIEGASEEIDAALGHIYKTPIVLDPDANASHRPAFLLLKKVNWLLASSRILFDVAAAGEDDNINAYGAQMLREAQVILAKVQDGSIPLVGPERLDQSTRDGVADTDFTGPRIVNEDDSSLVESFYQRGRPATTIGYGGPIALPYSGNNS